MNPGLDLDLDGAALTTQLVDIPSVSGDEGPLADAVESALRAREHLTVHRDGNVIVARTMLGRPQRVILAGHLDTVPLQAPVELVLVDGFWENANEGVLGADNKAAVAVLLWSS